MAKNVLVEVLKKYSLHHSDFGLQISLWVLVLVSVVVGIGRNLSESK